MNSDEISAVIKALQADARRLGLTWTLRPATVGQVLSDGTATVVLDGDTAQVQAISLIGLLTSNSRVMAMLVPPSGVYVLGFTSTQTPATGPRGQIGYVARDTASTPSAAAREVLRIDGMPVYAGRRYEISTSSLVLLNSVAGNTASARLSYEEGGLSATTTSQFLPINNQYSSTIANGAAAVAKGMYIPTVDTTLSVLLFTFTASGAGLTSIFADPNLWMAELWVNDVGATSQLTGTGFIL